MKRRLVVGTMVMVAALLSSEAVYAAPAASATFAHASVNKGKLISFNVRNDSKLEIKVKAGDSELTLEPGKVVPVKLAAGDQIVAVDSTPNYPAGTVVATASSDLKDATVVLR